MDDGDATRQLTHTRRRLVTPLDRTTGGCGDPETGARSRSRVPPSIAKSGHAGLRRQSIFLPPLMIPSDCAGWHSAADIRYTGFKSITCPQAISLRCIRIRESRQGGGRVFRETGSGAGPYICDVFTNATVQSSITNDRRCGQVKRKPQILFLLKIPSFTEKRV